MEACLSGLGEVAACRSAARGLYEYINQITKEGRVAVDKDPFVVQEGLSGGHEAGRTFVLGGRKRVGISSAGNLWELKERKRYPPNVYKEKLRCMGRLNSISAEFVGTCGGGGIQSEDLKRTGHRCKQSGGGHSIIATPDRRARENPASLASMTVAGK